jgi:carnitine O-acetyltransferase
LTPAEYEKTLKLVKDFGSDNGLGQKLNRLLEERAKSCENWLGEWWLSTAYLDYRDPVVVYSSPGLVFPLEDFKSKDDRLRYAAKLIHATLIYKKSIDDGTIPKDMMGKAPLDMSQYKKVLGTNRNPGKTKDCLAYHPNSKHFVVAYKNYFYKVPCYNSESGEPLSPSELLEQLKYIMVLSGLGQMGGLRGIPVGVLTSAHRDVWGKAYEKLVKDKVNKETVRVITESLFLVAIDQPNRPLTHPKGSAEADGVEDLAKSEKQTVAALQMIHGNKTNSGNRWFDKTIQFIVGSEGECGLTYEHSPAEGPPIANLMDYIVDQLPKLEPLLGTTKNTTEPPKHLPVKLDFNIDDKANISAITAAEKSLETLIADLDMACFTFKKYGKEFIKSCKFSPDSYIQMAIQSAFHRVHGIPGAHYESASTRMYAGGRTETIRSCSIESLEFSEALNNPTASTQDKYKLMKKAIEGHKLYAADAVRGYGVDRHLLGLKLIALQNGMALHELFTDKGYTFSSQFRLSTSQVPSVNQAFMCYGPLVPNGYGCCYNPTKNEMSFGISAMNSSAETNAEKFKIALQEVLMDMQKVAIQNIPSKL